MNYMELLDKKEYEKNLKELMETPFGYQQKPIITQPELEPKVINEQPVENQNTPVSATVQPQIHIIKEQQLQPSPFSLHKTGTAELNSRLGAVIAVEKEGLICGGGYHPLEEEDENED